MSSAAQAKDAILPLPTFTPAPAKLPDKNKVAAFGDLVLTANTSITTLLSEWVILTQQVLL